MARGVSALLLLLAGQTSRAYETWHLVDIQAAVCPMPEPKEGVPVVDFAIPINYTADLVVDRPHIFSFLRTSNNAMKITFSVKDADDHFVIEETTVDLAGQDGSKCTCAGTTPITTTGGALYEAGYGSFCKNWDQAKCTEVAKDQDLEPGLWCCREWCYVPAECKDAYGSTMQDGWYWSYGACRPDEPPATPPVCPYAEPDPCACIDASGIFDLAMQTKFNQTYGNKCAAWDIDNCARDYTPDKVDSWCCDNWCYVNKTCPTAQNSFNPGMEDKLFWSAKACAQDPKLTGQCPYSPSFPDEVGSEASCECLSEEMPSTFLPTGAPTTYGKICATHDQDKCAEFNPGASTGLWCCQTWCWVAETCKGRVQSAIWPGHYMSSTPCYVNDVVPTAAKNAIINCPAKYFSPGKNPCSCTGLAPVGIDAKFPTTLGQECKAWDVDDCDTWYPSSFNASGNNDWCCDSWCYVQEACPFAEPSGVKDGLFYAMDVCADTGPQKYSNSLGNCTTSRRLDDSEEDQDEVEGLMDSKLSEEEENGEVHGRRLPSSRRRSGSTFSAPRRRAPSPRPAPPPSRPIESPRRRAPAPITAGTPRRRASPLKTTLDSAARRRGMAAPASSSARRRGVGNGAQTPAYGYTQGNRNQVMNNYGGYMPQQQPYGYSGYQAYPQGSRPNVAMYAAGGAAAGLAAGVGGSYMYNQYYDQHGYNNVAFRRRRTSPMQWCIVPDGEPAAGEFMECTDCRRQHGFCQSADSCWSGSGCSYRLNKPANRDDLSATGFVPNQWTPPLKVTIHKIEAADIITKGPQTMCPPKDEAQAKEINQLSGFNRTTVIQADLFLTLTEQDNLGGGGIDASSGCRAFAGPAVLLAVLGLTMRR